MAAGTDDTKGFADMGLAEQGHIILKGRSGNSGSFIQEEIRRGVSLTWKNVRRVRCIRCHRLHTEREGKSLQQTGVHWPSENF